jgi:predicted helicase
MAVDTDTILKDYIKRLNTRYKTGISREHSYRGDLQNLLESLCPGVLVTNEPARVECGAPDYILTRRNVPIGYIEAKDIGEDITGRKHKEQFARYRGSLGNLIITDYLDFRLYRDGDFVKSVRIANADSGRIKPDPAAFADFAGLIEEFTVYSGQTVTSPKKLAGLMAGKARLLADIIKNAIIADEKTGYDNIHSGADNTLRQQLKAFKEVLIHDIDPGEFADIYAQTIAYGMFAARLNDKTLEDFSRQEAAELIPKSNPFLRKLFQYIAGYDLDDRIKWLVDALADVFRAADVSQILKNFGRATQQSDPMIHFYETFLGEYDPKLRKSRGVWYTPEPVVSFIVRAVDDILKSEFGLKDGLADTSMTTIKTEVPSSRSKSGFKLADEQVHRVQILDPAAGTGTFLAEVVRQIHKKFSAQQGIWSGYVDKHLLPRLNGFEILMASYAMAHLKLEMLLDETGYKPQTNQRLRVYLTNSLEEHHPDTGTLFANWLSTEANEANRIKRDTPVMCVIGNPPYSVSSSNKSEWIEELMKDYKKDLNERNIQPLSDDYIKFIRFGQHFIEKNGEGILAYISNNSFIDGLIHRQMRKHLLETFDKIYILDLHGNSNRGEISSDGCKDENVFDIQQGVSINIFIKKKEKKSDKQVFHFDITGKREEKYKELMSSQIQEIEWKPLDVNMPEFFYTPIDLNKKNLYNKNIYLKELFIESNVGLNTEFDELTLKENLYDTNSLLDDLINLSPDEILKKYNFSKKYLKKIENAKSDIEKHKHQVTKLLYRPFDEKTTIYTGFSNGFMGRPRHSIMKHMLEANIGLVTMRQYAYNVPDYCYSFLTKNIVASRLFISNKGYCTLMPLYLYPDADSDGVFAESGRVPNLNMDIVDKIAAKLGLRFTAEKDDSGGTFAPIDILDYIYAVLHSPAYREKYREFLKIDFPRVAYPENAAMFWRPAKLGGELRRVHLLESERVENYITSYPLDGDNVITRKMTAKSIGFEMRDEDNGTGRVWINDKQYFDGVPLSAWEFYIGGYQPAQKWLKDRYGRELSFDDILHYQKIIAALTETGRIMQEIDKTGFTG